MRFPMLLVLKPKKELKASTVDESGAIAYKAPKELALSSCGHYLSAGALIEVPDEEPG